MEFDVAVIGAGMYGMYVSKRLCVSGKKVVCLEANSEIFSRASRNNQARVHNGYHYPRSLRTAARSRILSSRFVQEFGESVFDKFEHKYLISAVDSKVSPAQFEYFMRTIGAPLVKDDTWRLQFTDDYMISAAYDVEEYAFNWRVLANVLLEQLDESSNFKLLLDFNVDAISEHGGLFELRSTSGEFVRAKRIVNATYSALNTVGRLVSSEFSCDIKHELTEMALVTPPTVLQGKAITVMCGPFFSLMPYPEKGLYSLSHVRYTPHFEWIDSNENSGMQLLAQNRQKSNFQWMQHDAARYLPALNEAIYCESLWEVKSVLARSETNDDRPVLFKQNGNCFHVFGGKIDNVFDLDRLIESKINVS